MVHRWIKCRVCTVAHDIEIQQFSKHVRQKKHLKRVAEFESTKPSAYVQQEIQFAERCQIAQTTDMETDTGPSPTQHSAGDSNDNGMEFFSHNDEWSSIEIDDASNAPPQLTSEDWMTQILSKCPNPKGDLSGYFSTEEETTPIDGLTRTPMNAQYFHCNLEFGWGPRLLTAWAAQRNTSLDILQRMGATNPLFCILLAYLTNRLTNIEQRVLVALMVYMSDPLNRGLPIPENHAQLRNCYGPDGRESIPNILPRPIIQILDTGFAYVSIRDILQFHLANGQTLDPLVDAPYSPQSKNVQSLHGSSQRGKDLVAFSNEQSNTQPTEFISEVVIWSDAFDTNNTKNNRGSVHVVLVSVGTPGDDYHSGRNTYPVSLGPSNGDMTTAMEKLVRELTELFKGQKNKFFHAASQKELAVSLRVYCFLQDRPERCSWLGLAYGNGRYGARFGWAGDLSQSCAYKRLPSCSDCNALRLCSPDVRHFQCTRCSDWRMDLLSYQIPKDYPTIFMNNNSDGTDPTAQNLPDSAPTDARVNGNCLRFRPITFPILKSASDSTFDMVRLRYWTKKQGIAYLETFGLSQVYIADLCNAADNPDEQQPPHPTTWNVPGVDIRHHIDALMHLCFLGITKAISTDLISGWLKAQRKSSSFYNLSHPVLDQIKRQSLSWCKVETKFGGYVSENWIAYCLVYKYVHQLLSKLTEDDDVYIDPPGVPLSQYNLKQRRAWLCARKVEDISNKSLKKAVDKKFLEFISLPPEECPPIIQPVASKATLEQASHMIICWQVCMSRIMSLDQNPSGAQLLDIERHIKVFLTSVDVFDLTRRDQATKKDMKVPVWRRKQNFLGLLNFRDTIREMGPLCPLSELDLNGNWAYNAMKKYFVEKSYKFALGACVRDVTNGLAGGEPGSCQAMMEVATEIANQASAPSTDSDTNDDDAFIQVRSQANYKSHKDEATAMRRLEESEFMSGLVVDDHLYLVIKTGGMNTYLEIRPVEFHLEVCGAQYFSYTTVASSGLESSRFKSCSEHFLLLPLLNNDGSVPKGKGRDGERNFFYVITSGWREISRSDRAGFVLRLPTIPGATY
ncbi:unnamed protein product [Cylindrotheca closterium]|uniref:Uncharacterized protein n=3 Tax=Cylindrotheca closterium TaxID=2856 RepID=A0AAD2FTR2_9STRA|nr:unnamed protein product [Cylindrotheca closterium]